MAAVLYRANWIRLQPAAEKVTAFPQLCWYIEPNKMVMGVQVVGATNVQP